MKNIHRVICFDLDGTLLDHTEHIRPGDIKMLQNEPDGTLFIPASGRSLTSVQNIFHDHSLFQETSLPFPLVLQNGAITYLPGEKVLKSIVFEPDVQAKLVDIVAVFTELPFFMVTTTHHYVLHPNPLTWETSRKYNFLDGDFTSGKSKVPLTKVMAISRDTSPLKELDRQVSSLPVERAFSLPTIYEITPLGANKGAALLDLLKELGVKDEVEILAAGDGENDLSLFPIATRSYAPANAAEQIRQAADVTIFPQEDGLIAAMLAEYAGYLGG
jgi:Cof subfamily protein (haloacid dehalogenase superfamily)